ncbi:MAG: hypothetical protein ABI380_08395 [Edaphobacter sp.]
MAIVMLAFAVFSWGIRYKLSLYNPASHMSAAKLLSQRERPATSEASELAADPLANPAPITLFGLALGVTLVGLFSLKPTFSKRNVWDRVQLPKRSGQNFFFFRPPPLLYSL